MTTFVMVHGACLGACIVLGCDRIAKKTYIRASRYPSVELDAGMAEASNKGWRTLEIATGHLAMIDAPALFAELLVQPA